MEVSVEVNGFMKIPYKTKYGAKIQILGLSLSLSLSMFPSRLVSLLGICFQLFI